MAEVIDWIQANLVLVLAIAGGIASWLNKRRQDAAGESDAAPSPERSFEDPELSERTRRIREEIQRKIAQRNSAPTSAPPLSSEPADAPELPPIFREIFAPEPRPVPARPAVSHAESVRTAEILEQQAALAEQLKQAKEMKAAALRRQQYEAEIADKQVAAVVAQTGALKDDLRNPAALRRAFVLREVLGPPVALR